VPVVDVGRDVPVVPVLLSLAGFSSFTSSFGSFSSSASHMATPQISRASEGPDVPANGRPGGLAARHKAPASRRTGPRLRREEWEHLSSLEVCEEGGGGCCVGEWVGRRVS